MNTTHLISHWSMEGAGVEDADDDEERGAEEPPELLVRGTDDEEWLPLDAVLELEPDAGPDA